MSVSWALSGVKREVQREGAAAAGIAFDPHEAAVAAHDVVDNREAEAGALRARPRIRLDPVELAEDLPLQPHRDLLRTYADADIHNVTAFLVTLK